MAQSRLVVIRDAELQQKLAGSLMESVEQGQEPNLAAQIKARTGIPVVAKLNESTGCVEVKRVLIG